MPSNEIINGDSVALSQAAANKNAEALRAVEQNIWKQHPDDLNDENGYWNRVRKGANLILREGYKQRTSAIADFFRDRLPGARPGSSDFADAEIEFDGSLQFHKWILDDVLHPKEAAERKR